MKRRSEILQNTRGSKDGALDSKGIRTRLSTGTLIMSGTSTAAAVHSEQHDSSALPSSSSTARADGASTSLASRKRKVADNKELNELPSIPPKRKKIGRNDGTGEDNKNDYFCWICHKEGLVICCELCPRVFHAKCLNIENNVPQDWVCPECERIMKAECTDTRSTAMKLITVNTLCTLLQYALDRMRSVGSEMLEQPVDPVQFANYSDYVFHPMCLSLLEKNIKRKNYGCTESFLADSKWIYHNSYVYNGAQNKITLAARAVLKVCKHEMSEIEVCPDCYYSSCLQSNSDWFCEPCRNPHPLVWAKLKGYPFWPAKALREANDQVDVRFFGAHDRSWVPVASCFMLSKTCPVIVKKGRGGMTEAMREVELHIKKLREKLGSFDYAPFRTPYSSDSVYSKIKNVSTGGSGDGSKQAGPGKMAVKNKAGEGRQGEKQSVVSKKAMAVKSKYITLTSKKGTQPPGSVLKLPLSTQQQIIYLKPMQKGVFILSEQSIGPLAITNTTSSQGRIMRPVLPDLQLMKISDKIQPASLPSSSKQLDSSSHCTDKERREAPTKEVVRGEKQAELEEVNSRETVEDKTADAVGQLEEPSSGSYPRSSLEDNCSRQDKLPSKKSATNLDALTRQLNQEPEISIGQSGMQMSEANKNKDGDIQNLRSKEEVSGKGGPVTDGGVQNLRSKEEVRSGDDGPVTDSQAGHSLVHDGAPSASGIREPSSSEDVQEPSTEQSAVSDESHVIKSSCSEAKVEEPPQQVLHNGDRASNASADFITDKDGADTENNEKIVGITGAIINPAAKVCDNQEKSVVASKDIGHASKDNGYASKVLSSIETEGHHDSAAKLTTDSEGSSEVVVITSSKTSTVTSTTVPAADVSPGSKYKESLQKVIDSCREKLGLSNDVENDDASCILGGADDEEEEEEDGIVVSDSELDDDSDVLLMDIDDENEEGLSSVPINASRSTSRKSTSESIQATALQNEVSDVNSKTSTQQKSSSCELEAGKTVALTPSSKDIPRASIVEDVNSSRADVLLKEETTGSKVTDIIEDVGNPTCNTDEVLHTSKTNDETNKTTSVASKETESSLSQKTTSSVEKVTDVPVDKAIEKVTNVPVDKAIILKVPVNKTADGRTINSKTVPHTAVTEARSKSVLFDKHSLSQLSRLEEIPPKSSLGPHHKDMAGASKEDDAISVISVIDDDDDDDDDNDTSIDDSMTLDMEVVCAEDSDGIETDNEPQQDVITLESNSRRKENNIQPERVPHRSLAQNATKTLTQNATNTLTKNAGKAAPTTKDPNASIPAASYPTLRETLTGDASSRLASTQTVSAVSPGPSPSSNSNTPATAKSITAQTTPRTDKHTPHVEQQRMKPRILKAAAAKKRPVTLISDKNSMVISLDDCGGDFEDEDQNENTESSSESDMNVAQARVSRDECSAASKNAGLESATGNLQHSRTRDVTEAGETNSSEAQQAKVKSLVQDRCAAIEKFLKDQLHGMAEDIQKSTEKAALQPSMNERNSQSVEIQKEKYEKQLEDLKKTMNSTLKEALASYKHQKLMLEQKLKEEFTTLLTKAVADTKKQQWCAECWKEAVYYCCWNTSYCSYQCQQKHWPNHMPKCMQAQQQQQQSQGTTAQAASRSPSIISTLSSSTSTGKSKTTSSSSNSSTAQTTTAQTSQPMAAVTPMKVSKAAHRVPTVSIVSPSQWKASEDASKTKKMFSLVCPQTVSNESSWPQTQQTFTAAGTPRQSGNTGTSVQLLSQAQNMQQTSTASTLSFGPTQFHIQYLQQQGATGTLPQQVQVVGASPTSIPVIMPSLMSSTAAQSSSVQLLHNTASVFPLMQRAQQATQQPQQQQQQQIGGTRYIIPGAFSTFMRPGGPV